MAGAALSERLHAHWRGAPSMIGSYSYQLDRGTLFCFFEIGLRLRCAFGVRSRAYLGLNPCASAAGPIGEASAVAVRPAALAVRCNISDPLAVVPSERGKKYRRRPGQMLRSCRLVNVSTRLVSAVFRLTQKIFNVHALTSSRKAMGSTIDSFRQAAS